MANELILFTKLELPKLAFPSDERPKEVSSVAYAPDDPNRCWVGTSQGQLFKSTTGAQGTWSSVRVEGLPADARVTRIVVDAHDHDTVAIATASAPPKDATLRPEPGQVFLSRTGGTTFSEVSQRVRDGKDWKRGVGLPPSPITALAFDPRPSGNRLYAGALGGVYVLDYAATSPSWRVLKAELPLVLITDLATTPQGKLLCSTYGRGIFELELDAPPALPQVELYIRQHVVERGEQYPRVYSFPGPNGKNVLENDPRGSTLPLSMDIENPRALRAFDIRVGGGRFRAPSEHIDSSEFDVELRHQKIELGRASPIYVQVHNRGMGPAAEDVQVHLYVAPYVPSSLLVRLPNGFWGSLGSAPPAGNWTWIGTQSVRLGAGEHQVVRPFEWTPTSAFAPRALLLALCSSANDPLTNGPAPDPLDVGALLLNERRAAGRLVELSGNVFVRNGVDDPGDNPALGLLARSPDIIVTNATLSDADARQRFSDLGDPAPGDALGATNFVRVRVHNASEVVLAAKVTLYAVPAATASDWGEHPLGAEVIVTSLPAAGGGAAPAGINPHEWALSPEIAFNLSAPITAQLIVARIQGVLNPGALQETLDEYPLTPFRSNRGSQGGFAYHLLQIAGSNTALRAFGS